ncbi:adenosylhomocysteinase [Saccharopolyspora shandongensis]|uniref:adenosylhomocysteinase n=1 Tax=Saccharopolyspora shandongensis TaxID=418495 RepID=UPI0033D811B6
MLLVGRDDEVRRREHGVRRVGHRDREPTSTQHRGSSRGGYIGGTTAFARLDLAEGSMPALAALRRDFSSSKPLAGRRLLIAGLVTAGSAVTAHTARAMGASVVWCATSARHFDREVADHLRESGCVAHDPTGAGGVRSAIRSSLAAWRDGPTALLDDDAVLTTALHAEFAEFPGPQFAVERTTRGAQLIKKRPSESTKWTTDCVNCPSVLRRARNRPIWMVTSATNPGSAIRRCTARRAANPAWRWRREWSRPSATRSNGTARWPW